MAIENLSANVVRGLQSISVPSRYLYPGPEESQTGPLSDSLLLLGTGRNGGTFQRPGFHRVYRMLDQLTDLFVEHFVRPKSDYYRMTKKRNEDPWSLESRRSIFSFPAWICFLSWPGDWIQLQQLLDELKSFDNFKHTGPLVCIVPSPSFPLLDDVTDEADFTFSGPSLPRDPDALQTLLKRILQNGQKPGQGVIEQDVTDSDPLSGRKWSSTHIPVPFLASDVLHQYWIGQITQFDQNQSLQNPSWPSFRHRAPQDVLDQLVDVINQQGLQHVTMGTALPEDSTEPEQWTLEFLERFHSRWGQRPICYQLDNPRPDHPVWTYEHLLERYNNTALHTHLGEPEETGLQSTDPENLDRWLNYFLSAGGPKMTFNVDSVLTPESVDPIRNLCTRLQSLNEQYIDGKGQLRVRIHPLLDRRGTWSSIRQLRDVVERVQSDVPDGTRIVDLHLPDHYETMLQRANDSSEET